jgi:Predicted transcriptional regulator
MTSLHITVGDRAQLQEETLQFIQQADNGELTPDDERAVLQFGSYADLVESLTPLRLELIRAIAAESPESMREAARLVDRDVSDVHADLKQLEVLGVLDLEAGGPGGAIQPFVPFDSIEMHIEYPLLADPDADSRPASAD